VSDDLLDAGELDAGEFSAWLAGMHAVLRGEAESTVPCGTCTACCTSSQFVHIEPDETDALAHIPAALRFPAPGLPTGHVLLGYDEHGRCPMLGNHGCTIYEHRPRTCRTYDCRVFAATGIEPDESQPAIAAQVRRWRFDVATPVTPVAPVATADAYDAYDAYDDQEHAGNALARALSSLRRIGTGST
jgi:Fe-S-cluster containining protein